MFILKIVACFFVILFMLNLNDSEAYPFAFSMLLISGLDRFAAWADRHSNATM